MKKQILRSFLIFIGLVVLYFYMDSTLEQFWHCETKKEILQQEAYLKKIESKYKSEVYFWSWINYEGFLPDVKLPKANLCSRSIEQKKSDWLWLNFWSYLYPNTYNAFQQNVRQIAQYNLHIYNKISEFEKNRDQWWQKLNYDLKKICSLQIQIKRLKKLHEHLLSACRMPASSAPQNLCLKDIKNMEKLIQREEIPLKENREKMQLKWPYLPEEISCE